MFGITDTDADADTDTSQKAMQQVTPGNI